MTIVNKKLVYDDELFSVLNYAMSAIRFRKANCCKIFSILDKESIFDEELSIGYAEEIRALDNSLNELEHIYFFLRNGVKDEICLEYSRNRVD